MPVLKINYKNVEILVRYYITALSSKTISVPKSNILTKVETMWMYSLPFQNRRPCSLILPKTVRLCESSSNIHKRLKSKLP
eukprot:UN10670